MYIFNSPSFESLLLSYFANNNDISQIFSMKELWSHTQSHYKDKKHQICLSLSDCDIRGIPTFFYRSRYSVLD